MQEYAALLDHVTKNDRALFEDIARFSQKHSQYAELLVDLMIKRSQATTVENRINYYYAIDSVVKMNKGEFTKLYGKRLCQVVPEDLKQFGQKGPELKKSFLILFLTWESCISLSYLNKMLRDYLCLTNDVFLSSHPCLVCRI